MSRPTICFATMCKNEEHCIQETLACVAPFIDYWVVSDTGSTDWTCEIVEAFFRERGIPGELHHDEWTNFDVNKTLLFQHAYKKADYVLHMDADDLLEGDFSFTKEDAGKLSYKCWTKRGDHSSCRYLVQLMFDNNHIWKFAGVAHTIIRCLDNTEGLQDGSLADKPFILNSRDTGNRSNDTDKYAKDAEKLKDQFFRTLVDDPDGINTRSVFYAAQSYRDSSQWLEAIQWYSLYTRMKNTWYEEVYMSYWNMGNMYNRLGNFIKAEESYKKAIEVCPDRAEAYLSLGTFYNHHKRFEEAYELLHQAKKINLEITKQKYLLFIDERSYGKFINDELSVSCYWLKKHVESKSLIETILDDHDFRHAKERLQRNLEYSIACLY